MFFVKGNGIVILSVSSLQTLMMVVLLLVGSRKSLSDHGKKTTVSTTSWFVLKCHEKCFTNDEITAVHFMLEKGFQRNINVSLVYGL